MKLNKLVLALLVLIAGGVLVRSSYGYPPLPGQKYGAGTLPFLFGVVGIALGGALCLQSWNARGDALVRITATMSGRAAWGGLVTILAIVGYIVLADRVGFIPVAVLTLTVLMWLGNVPLARAVAIAVVAALLCYVVFSRFLLVPLPSGPIETALWQAVFG